MLFRETGDSSLPAIVLLHGGGLSDWSWDGVTERLRQRYRCITPVIDGHGDDGRTTFVSIEDSASKLLAYLDENLDGKIFAIGGLSLGAQIAVEALAARGDIAQYALIESASVCPMKTVAALAGPLCSLSYPLIGQRWFSRAQARALHVPEDRFDRYYQDSRNMSRETLVNIMRSNATYGLKDMLPLVRAKTLVLVGSKEIRTMRRSAQMLSDRIEGSRLMVAEGMDHGEMSLVYPERYVQQLEGLFSEPR